jgi:hypothetical protein
MSGRPRFVPDAIPGSNGQWWAVYDLLAHEDAPRRHIATFTYGDRAVNWYAAHEHADWMNGEHAPLLCEHPECGTRIERSEAYRCHGDGCGGHFFCYAHLFHVAGQRGSLCSDCSPRP